jgi:DNA-nicking Smr family endonuclease
MPNRHGHSSRPDPGDEIDLHGLTVDEAIPKMDDFLDKALQPGHLRVWVIHGKGSGVLRQEVKRYLSKHSLVMGQGEPNAQRG